MPNGFMGPKDEWERMEAPYIRIDPILEDFARRHGLAVHENYRDADRSLRFNDALARAVWVHSSDLHGESGTYDVCVVAHQDRPERFTKFERITHGVAMAELAAVLERAVSIVQGWSESDLVRAYPDDFGTFRGWLRRRLSRLFGFTK